jgi:hypothetical protein
MTSGRWLVVALLAITAVFGAAFWWFQTRAYYAPVDAADLSAMDETGASFALAPAIFEGIDASTSPLRYRACFTLDAEGIAAAGQGAPYADPTPLTAPGWFDCFDAPAIADALASGQARAILGHREIHRGVDRVVVLFPDGRGYAWQQLNGTLD